MSYIKECNNCHSDKTLFDFGNDKRNQDGKQGTCRDCCNSIRRKKYKLDVDYRSSQKKRQKRYLDYANRKAQKHIQAVSDFYVIKELKRGTNLTTNDIKKHPELIEAKRQVILNKRLCKLTISKI